MLRFDTVVVSDLHLGARNSRRASVLRFFETVETSHLVLAGDVFDHPRLRRLGGPDLAVLERLRELGRHIRVTWLRGNHDPDDCWTRSLLGLDVAEEVLLDVGGRPYLVCHGHLFDHTLDLPSWIIFLAEAIYRGAQAVDSTHRLARQLKRASRSFQQIHEQITARAIEAGRRRAVAGIVWGHSHVAVDVRHHGLHVLNTGCWTETPSGFVGIRDGEAGTYFWDDARCRATRLTAIPQPAGRRQLSRRWSEVPALPS